MSDAEASEMRLLSPLAVAVLALTLSGCVTAEEQRAADEATCRSYGFRQNNDAFAECLQRIDLNRRADMRAMQSYEPFWGPPVVYRPVIVRPRRHRPS